MTETKKEREREREAETDTQTKQTHRGKTDRQKQILSIIEESNSELVSYLTEEYQ